MTDFIIVGQGLAANALMHQFYTHGISFKTIGKTGLSTCSQVAAGIWNPIVFKRMCKSWMADELIPKLHAFYSDCETRLNLKLLHQQQIIKPFIEEQEKNLWLKKAVNELADFLDADIKNDSHTELINCNLPWQYGCVKQAGYIDLPSFLQGTQDFFKDDVTDDVFDYTMLNITEAGVTYKSLQARNIIFCEGFLVNNNPWFNWIPLKPAKGEVITVKSDELKLRNFIFNRNGFILRTPEGHFKAGATYAWQFNGQRPSAEGLEELQNKLSQLITCKTEIINHQAGIRPASMDRRPILGAHPKYNNLFVFNGLGTKGVMLAPYFSENFVHFYLQKTEIDPNVNVKRFYRYYEEQRKKQN